MAEICSGYPTAGGLYYWSAKLAQARTRLRGAGSPAGSTCSARWPSRPASTRRRALLHCLPRPDHWDCRSHARAHPHRGLAAHPRRSTALLNTFGVRIVAFLFRRQHVVAHPRRAASSSASSLVIPAQHAVGDVRVHASSSTTPASQPAVWYVFLHRAAAGAVHLHRVRRLGPHDRGDPRRRAWPARAASSGRFSCR